MIEKCGGAFPPWEFERRDPRIKFFLPKICQTCDFINGCAFNALMQVAGANEYFLDRDEAITLGKASDKRISQLSPTHKEITDLIGERMVSKLGGPERIEEGMPNLAAMIESIGSSKQ